MIHNSCKHLTEESSDELQKINLHMASAKLGLYSGLCYSCEFHSYTLVFFFRLKSLTYMSINYNQLVSIPRELCFLKNLVELQLNYNQLICIPEEIKFLKKLQKFLLARNNIGVLPEVSKTWSHTTLLLEKNST